MNILETTRRAQILNCLVEGCSMRSTTRLTNVSINTVKKLLIDAGKVCAEYMDKTMNNLPCKVIQVDEMWSFTYAKQKNLPEHLQHEEGFGDTWTWISMCTDTKLVPCFHVGKRNASDAYFFINNLAPRLKQRVQLTSDGLKAYLEAVEGAFGSDIDYAQLIKLYGNENQGGEVRYSPAECTGTRKMRVSGKPVVSRISTSHIERQNLSVRMGSRRFTRLTNGFSKKFEHHKHAVAIHFMHYNFCRIHTTLRVTPAMEANLTDHVWSMEEVVAMIKS